MSDEKPKSRFSTKKLLLFVIVLLLVVVCVLFDKYWNAKYALLEYRYIPHIELKNALYDASDRSLLLGSIKGFVVFNNPADQPKDLRQYYIIEGLNKFDKNLNQFFSIEEIVSLGSLPPASLGKVEIVEKSNSPTSVTLEDEEGTQFFINKISKEVAIVDANGDNVGLITDNWDYREFMQEFLKK